MKTEDLKQIYECVGGTNFNSDWTYFNIWCEIAKLKGVDVTNCYSINEVLKKLDGLL